MSNIVRARVTVRGTRPLLQHAFGPESIALEKGEKTGVAGNDPEELNKVVANIVSVLSDNIVVTNVKDSGNFYKTGLSSLFESPEFREFDRVFNVANVFDHFEKVFNEIESEFLGVDRSEISVYIGSENPIKNIKEEAVILVKYPLPNRKKGSMTIIGPMRMDYQKNIGLAKCIVDELKFKSKNYDG